VSGIDMRPLSKAELDCRRGEIADQAVTILCGISSTPLGIGGSKSIRWLNGVSGPPKPPTRRRHRQGIRIR